MLEVKDLAFEYSNYSLPSRGKLFEDISFCLKENENILILGKPESGKSTLSTILSGLCPKYNDGVLSGSITYDGLSLSDSLSKMDVFSLIPQNSAAYIISSTVEEEIVFPLESLGLKKSEIDRRLNIALDTWGLRELKDVSTAELSGGEKRRLMLAASQVVDAKYVIYDEAFDDLDINYRARLKESLQKREHSSILFQAHYIPYFDDLFDKIYILDKTLIEADEKALKQFSFIPKLVIEGSSNSTLLCKDIKFQHPHRSVKEEHPFCISIKEFYIKKGEVVTLSGLNGSGKSTFSSLLCGLLPYDEGVITYNDKILKRRELSRTIGYMFQNPDWQIFLPTVRDELSLSLDYLSLSRKEKDERINNLLDLFNLNGDAIASIMSYGERKRLQAAIYYNLERPFYILDELDSALDYEASIYLIKLLASKGSGILLITHDEEFSKSISSRSYTLDKGVMNAI